MGADFSAGDHNSGHKLMSPDDDLAGKLEARETADGESGIY